MSFSQDLFKKIAKIQGHSDSFIEACLQYATSLQEKGLSVLFSINHLAEVLEIPDLKNIINNREAHYKFYQIRKRKNSGYRQIVIPYHKLKHAQRFINEAILKKVQLGTVVHGFVSEKSIKTNAHLHSKAPAILNIDLLKFFDTITEKRVFGIFRSLGYARNLCVDLAKITTVPLPRKYIESFSEQEMKAYNRLVKKNEPVLPQGAPTSPALSNIILRRLDMRLYNLAQKRNVRYTRYADDLTFSGDLDHLPNIRLIARIIKEEGFNINWEKVNIYKKGGLQSVTGLTVSDGVHVHRSFKKEIKKHLYCCLKFGVDAHIKHLGLENKRFYKEWLLGKINFLRSIEYEFGQTLLYDFNKISWSLYEAGDKQ